MLNDKNCLLSGACALQELTEGGGSTFLLLVLVLSFLIADLGATGQSKRARAVGSPQGPPGSL